jgi:hypothetical protein
MTAAWTIWAYTFCTSLPSNCGSWTNISPKIFRKLNSIQADFVRMIYSSPPTTPSTEKPGSNGGDRVPDLEEDGLSVSPHLPLHQQRELQQAAAGGAVGDWVGQSHEGDKGAVHPGGAYNNILSRQI